MLAWPGLTKAAESNEFLLIRRSVAMPRQSTAAGEVLPIRLASITDQHVEHLPADRSWDRIPLNECIALLNPGATLRQHLTGLLVLADGQRLPGEHTPAGSAEAPGDPPGVSWTHPWLGQLQVPLNAVATVAFAGSATAPPPGGLDVVLLANGDRREGLVMSIGDSVTLEVDRAGEPPQLIEIQIDLVAAITMVPTRTAGAKSARRIWFDEGTVIDAQSIAVGDDGFVRMAGSPLISGTQPTRVGLQQIAAILLDPRGMIPLASLSPSRVEGPSTRYMLPAPAPSNPQAPLGLSAIEYSGPLVARYILPPGAQRLIAEAELPPNSRRYGDFELVIRSNDSELFRVRLNAAHPVASINVALGGPVSASSESGRELTIELMEGGGGPIQDRLILHRPMLLMRR
jgi:hypothetical protein